MNDGHKTRSQRFSQLYLKRGEPSRDSKRMRKRLSRLIESNYIFERNAVTLERELGIDLPSGFNGVIWPRFFDGAELRDVLDSITIFTRIMVLGGFNPRGFLNEIERIFREENVGYRVDAEGVVHFFEDHEFEHNRSSTVAALAPERYAAVRHAITAAYSRLDGTPPDYQASLRSIFDAAENMFKLMFDESRLGSKEVKKNLIPILTTLYSNDDAARTLAVKQANAFSEWIDGMHVYRHAPGSETVSHPPHDVAVLALSTGTSYVRWLAEIDHHRAHDPQGPQVPSGPATPGGTAGTTP